MAPDHQKTTSNAARPLMPTLASRRNIQSPITPKLAGHTKPSTTPLSRLSVQSEVLLSPHTPSAPTLITPSKSFPVNHVTPRSSRRQSRVETTKLTPVTLPGSVLSPSPGSPPKSVDGWQINNGLGNRVMGARSPLSVVSGGEDAISPGYFLCIPGVSPLARSGPGSDTGHGEERQLFFRADDATAQVRPKRPPMAQKTSSFYYANGEQLHSELRSPAVSSIGGSNEIHSEKKTSQYSDGPRSDSVFQFRSSPGPMPSPMFVSLPPQHLPRHSLKPPSPSRESMHLSYRKGASQIMPPSTHRPPIPTTRTPTPSARIAPPALRRSSTEVFMQRPSPARTTSLGSIDAKMTSTFSPALAAPPECFDMGGAVSGPDDGKSDLSTGSGFPLHSPLHSPTKHDPQQHDDLAASARQERKVLDLEISNSSLLAVNRTLEREVRKQKAELRRFRRLTRAGRLSTATTGSSVDGLLTLAEDDGDSRLSMGLTEEEQDDSYASDDASVEDDDALSPGALAESDARHREDDERRLQADLSRHRELLVDSSKMNQSIKRCLDYTDALIKEGRKALEYRVRVSDVKLGGRILAHDDEDDDSKNVSEGVQDDVVLKPHRLEDFPVERQYSLPQRTSWDSGVELESPLKSTFDESGEKT